MVFINLIVLFVFSVYCILSTNSRLFEIMLDMNLLLGSLLIFWMIDIFVFIIYFIDEELVLSTLQNKVYDVVIAISLLRMKRS